MKRILMALTMIILIGCGLSYGQGIVTRPTKPRKEQPIKKNTNKDSNQKTKQNNNTPKHQDDKAETTEIKKENSESMKSQKAEVNITTVDGSDEALKNKSTVNKVKKYNDLIVRNFQLCPNDLTAVTEKKYDQNGKPAALIKIYTELDPEQTYFDNGVMGIVARENKPGQIWLYLPARSQKILISNSYYPTLKYFFEEEIMAGKTYSMQLSPSY